MQVTALSTVKLVRILLQWAGLIISMASVGWVLSAFSASGLVWSCTGLVMVYLLWVGKGGVFPASAWVTVLITLVVAVNRFPTFWPQTLQYRYWAMSLMGIWAAAMVVIYGLGLYGDYCSRQALKFRRMTYGVTLATVLIGLQSGQAIYRAMGLG